MGRIANLCKNKYRNSDKYARTRASLGIAIRECLFVAMIVAISHWRLDNSHASSACPDL